MQMKKHWIVMAKCGEGLVFDNEQDALYAKTGVSTSFATPSIANDFREAYAGTPMRIIEIELPVPSARKKRVTTPA